MIEIRKAIILSGGLGLRMEPLSQYIPKTLLPISNKPIIIHHIERLEKCGIEEIFITIDNILGEMVKISVLNGYKGKARINFIVQNKRGGLGYAVLLCQTFIGGEKFIVQFGDEINETTNFYRTFAHNRFNRYDGIIGILDPSTEDRIITTATLKLDRNNVIDYIEKPSRAEILSTASTSGTYMFSPDFFEALTITRKLPNCYVNCEHSIGAAIKVFIEQNKKIGYIKESGAHAHLTDITSYWENYGWKL